MSYFNRLYTEKPAYKVFCARSETDITTGFEPVIGGSNPSGRTMNKKIAFLTVILVVAIVAIYFAFFHTKPIEPASAPTTTEKYNDSFIVGYEGDFQKVSYSLTYPKDNFAVQSMASAPSTVIIRTLKDNSINTLKFFYNGAAGFESAQQLWDQQYKFQCPDCLKSSAKLDHQTSDYIIYENNSDEWIVFAQMPGFVIADLKKPSIDSINIIESLVVSSQKGFTMPEMATIKVYFAKDNSTSTDCKNVAPVEKTIIKTPRVAAAAIETLFSGPSDQNKSDGYFSAIPTGSMLNSISINNGIAYADFNAQTESGGGSCSMAMRVAQIRQTLFQFSTVKNVVLSINDSTEPIFQP